MTVQSKSSLMNIYLLTITGIGSAAIFDGGVVVAGGSNVVIAIMALFLAVLMLALMIYRHGNRLVLVPVHLIESWMEILISSVLIVEGILFFYSIKSIFLSAVLIFLSLLFFTAALYFVHGFHRGRWKW